MVVRRSTRRWDFARLPPRPEITFNMAIQYVQEVQAAYAQQPFVYQQFLDLVSVARGRGRGVYVAQFCLPTRALTFAHSTRANDPIRNAIVATVDSIADLFGRYGHPDLIRGFDKFLPTGMRLHLAEPAGDGERVVVLIVASQAADEIFEIVVPQPGKKRM